MKYQTTRFGEIEVEDEAIVFFPSGILGFPESRKFSLIPHPRGGPYLWLQSLDFPEVAFVMCEPQIFVPEYKIDIKLEELSSIDAEKIEDVRVYNILRIPPAPQKPTINLVGPIIINLRKSIGLQHVVNNSSWSHQHEIGSCSS